MSQSKITCLNCKAQFYSNNKIVCGVCDKPFCPNCNTCNCTYVSNTLNSKKKLIISLRDLEKVKENQILEITAILSPLIGQTPVPTTKGIILKTEFELSEDHQKVPLIIWGPVPEKIFQTRYEFTNITISGLRKKSFNGKISLVATKTTKYYSNNLKTKSLDYFISESIS